MCFIVILFLGILYSLNLVVPTSLPGVALLIEDIFCQAELIPELRENCPLSAGISVRITPESPSAFRRKECPV
ncbi:hypothetical protein AU468_11690 [Alkalispirochaeta sphaeroplastigenens]|uniref:Uncharacterized protein n=1 Tax=Alkalispirochaeta sphaeroplastigenens TaxID=1187066 RepID=A0A2S4JH97_9SPIO|nr:hypothetical protein AU468_11690 [Alkalispirochaeta sphaeroplastigenens]